MPYQHRLLHIALALSLLLHGLLLFFPLRSPPGPEAAATRFEARLAQPVAPPPPAPAPANQGPTKQKSSKRVLAVDKAKPASKNIAPPAWSAKEKAEMNHFLDELSAQAKSAPPLAQRSLAMARHQAQAMARQDEAGNETMERVPNGPPADPFSLEMYLDAVVKKLNRSAAFVRNDPRSRGMHSALVRVRLNPNGSLRSFDIINAADQKDEIAFVRSVVEQAIPFAAFPADLRQSALSLGMLICIRPSMMGDGGFGFSRDRDGRGC